MEMGLKLNGVPESRWRESGLVPFAMLYASQVMVQQQEGTAKNEFTVHFGTSPPPQAKVGRSRLVGFSQRKKKFLLAEKFHNILLLLLVLPCDRRRRRAEGKGVKDPNPSFTFSWGKNRRKEPRVVWCSALLLSRTQNHTPKIETGRSNNCNNKRESQQREGLLLCLLLSVEVEIESPSTSSHPV